MKQNLINVSKAVAQGNHFEIVVKFYQEEPYLNAPVLETGISGGKEQMITFWSNNIEDINFDQFKFNNLTKMLVKTFGLIINDGLILNPRDPEASAHLYYDSITFELSSKDLKRGSGTKEIRTGVRHYTIQEEGTAHYGDETWGTGFYHDVEVSEEYQYRDWTPATIDRNQHKYIQIRFINNSENQNREFMLYYLRDRYLEYLRWRYGDAEIPKICLETYENIEKEHKLESHKNWILNNIKIAERRLDEAQEQFNMAKRRLLQLKDAYPKYQEAICNTIKMKDEYRKLRSKLRPDRRTPQWYFDELYNLVQHSKEIIDEEFFSLQTRRWRGYDLWEGEYTDEYVRSVNALKDTYSRRQKEIPLLEQELQKLKQEISEL